MLSSPRKRYALRLAMIKSPHSLPDYGSASANSATAQFNSLHHRGVLVLAGSPRALRRSAAGILFPASAIVPKGNPAQAVRDALNGVSYWRPRFYPET